MTTHASEERLAAGLAARILHDLSGPASAVASAIDLLAEDRSAAADGAALELALASGRSLLDLLELQKAAFGPTGEAVGAETLRRLGELPFAGRRPRLEWGALPGEAAAPAAQALFILLQIAASALAAGGVAKATLGRVDGALAIRIDGEGPRAALPPEALEGLQGRPLSEGLAGRWAPARYAYALVTGAGGALAAMAEAGRFSLAASLPAATPKL